ncbi:BRO-N domain-containing protein [Paracoccus aerodenitrificans]|uniref:BRO-N domain-containing protein n=1 Tax=Paracoccus aerodenitrificans TaxID=3017781 RepID=UPI0022F07F5D|nr:BRO family protein [Paracoccus aerodenitrificans]WBU63119.1 BRO family protein [Paracoccus aerodenitrificans]
MTLEGEPWFVVRDVLNVLGIKGMSCELMNVGKTYVEELQMPGQRGGRPNKLINEAGLYKLILRSNKPEAKEFQDWVTGEVLPRIRKTGSYVAGEEKFDVSTDEGLAATTTLVMAAMELAGTVLGGLPGASWWRVAGCR